jgi:hypothetical protein
MTKKRIKTFDMPSGFKLTIQDEERLEAHAILEKDGKKVIGETIYLTEYKAGQFSMIYDAMLELWYKLYGDGE